MKSGKIVLYVLIGAVALIGLAYLGMVVGLITLPARVINQAATPEKVIFNYEYFHQTYQDIKVAAIKIKTAYGAMKMDGLSEEQKSTYTTNYIGLQNFMQTMVAEYNARSKMLTRKLFKDKQLPYQVSVSVDDGNVVITETE